VNVRLLPSVAETTLTICCVVLGWWVQCHVLCQQWCCACWRWWNTESYEACCCTRDTQLGSVNFSCWKFLWFFKILPQCKMTLLVGQLERHPACKILSGGVLVWLSVWSEVQTCIWPSWCHCHLLSLASVKSRSVFSFWYRLSRVVLEKGPLNGCVWLSLLWEAV